MAEIEDPGIAVDDILDNQSKLEEKAKIETGEDVVADTDWEVVNRFESLDTVRAVLLQQRTPGGIVRVNGNPSRHTLTSRVTGTVLVAARSGEKITLVGNPYVLRFRRRQ
ncbi:hypothetical protein UA08_09129 [Talaromyces atroroseus]|uniref:Uncharacterized protein n=1 Tax=Talaromyces atroroseus TaxID=1441469 RepID=A0A1Q5Q754_TALAT|nr:hypothetical protein UA08_09129 [Talaromyces atroroseus]OKL55593.1 hypothetical protein UA08_09129 [Talaromyces atroroseus]